MDSKKLIYWISLLIILILSSTGCQANSTPQVITVEVTREVEITKVVLVPVTVTWTPTPENSPTLTPTPTITSTPTITPTPSDTPTVTPTPNATQTQQAIINATQGAHATATQMAKIAKATEVAQYHTIAKGELLDYADNHKGEKIKIEGQVFNINLPYTVQIDITNLGYGFWKDPIHIQMRDRFSGLYDDDLVIVYGTIDGMYCFDTVRGGQTCQPSLVDAFYIKK